jgi:lipopolysaccharide transport system ATP-binding protein
MSANAILVENLSKRYLIGHQVASRDKWSTVRDTIAREAHNFVSKAADFVRGRQVVQGDEIEEFWALRDVSFEVKHGEVLGIIGRNGAGKSTLLKILSRITEPTKGRISLSGRVSSLLEVGTGFHPELTGRENIFLYGAILGMTQHEIRKKFDEIVAFADFEKFVDTPVKHYSSGMYVRLAFAVAAHLEPEILIVDEVLAVGDAEFQKKCLGKMGEVSRTDGRTILFVSHNMDAVFKLCTRAVLLDLGRIHATGDPKIIVPRYLDTQSTSWRIVDLSSRARRPHCLGKAQLARICPSDPNGSWSLPFGELLSLDLSIKSQSSMAHVEIGIFIFSVLGFEVASWTNKCSDVELQVRPGINSFRISFRDFRLLPGKYSIMIRVVDCKGADDVIADAVLFEITSNPEATAINAQGFGGAMVPAATVSILDDGASRLFETTRC